MTGMSKMAQYCENGCRLTHDETKSVQSLQNHYALCGKKQKRWLQIRDADQAATKLLQLKVESESEESDEEFERIGLAVFPEVRKERIVKETMEKLKLNMTPKVERRARRTFAAKSPEEKAKTDFKTFDDVITRNSRNRKVKP